MTSRSFARIFMDDLIAFVDQLLTVLAYFVATVIMGAPWIILWVGGWRLFLRLYLLPYPFILVSFALIMALLNRRELVARVRNRRAPRKPTESKKAA